MHMHANVHLHSGEVFGAGFLRGRPTCPQVVALCVFSHLLFSVQEVKRSRLMANTRDVCTAAEKTFTCHLQQGAEGGSRH